MWETVVIYNSILLITYNGICLSVSAKENIGFPEKKRLTHLASLEWLIKKLTCL